MPDTINPHENSFPPRYRLVSSAGKGGYSEVFLVTDNIESGRSTAIKRISRNFVWNDRALAHMAVEAEALRRINNPGVPAFYARGVWEGTEYIAMQWMEGMMLNKMAESMPLFVHQHLARIFHQVCEILEHIHALRIIHMDVKLGNILVDGREPPTVSLIDFNIAEVPEMERPLLEAGSIEGTIAYVPPERYTGTSWEEKHRQDIYAAGACMYAVMFGEKSLLSAENRPWYVSDKGMIWWDRKIPLPSTLHPALAYIIGRAMAIEPTMRFQTASEMKEALSQFIQA